MVSERPTSKALFKTLCNTGSDRLGSSTDEIEVTSDRCVAVDDGFSASGERTNANWLDVDTPLRTCMIDD